MTGSWRSRDMFDELRAKEKELLCREEELKRAALQQKSHEESLRQREHALAQWELDVFERELSLLIYQMNAEKPNVKKRKGTFKKNKLKVKDGQCISRPSDFQHKLTVQASPVLAKKKGPFNIGSSPANHSPFVPRLRAIQLIPNESNGGWSGRSAWNHENSDGEESGKGARRPRRSRGNDGAGKQRQTPADGRAKPGVDNGMWMAESADEGPYTNSTGDSNPAAEDDRNGVQLSDETLVGGGGEPVDNGGCRGDRARCAGRSLHRALLGSAAMLAAVGLGRSLQRLQLAEVGGQTSPPPPPAREDEGSPRLAHCKKARKELQAPAVLIDLSPGPDPPLLPGPPVTPRRERRRLGRERQRPETSGNSTGDVVSPVRLWDEEKPAVPASPELCLYRVGLRADPPTAMALPRPRPSPARARIDPWSCVSTGPTPDPSRPPAPDPSPGNPFRPPAPLGPAVPPRPPEPLRPARPVLPHSGQSWNLELPLPPAARGGSCRAQSHRPRLGGVGPGLSPAHGVGSGQVRAEVRPSPDLRQTTVPTHARTGHRGGARQLSSARAAWWHGGSRERGRAVPRSATDWHRQRHIHTHTQEIHRDIHTQETHRDIYTHTGDT
ncbi:mitogen-activated protein kinase kinase kinase 11-like [Leucoraja erinacea]|uniref:mitogen-activated protein kinase kinase kinase 11-like n=1 Tax=Leucoraja erinaceus TaxID=7782 RepID=UPI002456CDCF|nr:mitogen-activated protein kinase kinase kinase 11-like [Leucoraja erinacea]